MFFLSCPSTFLALKVQLVVLVSAFVMVGIQFYQFLVGCSTRGPPCPAICNRAYGVGATATLLTNAASIRSLQSSLFHLPCPLKPLSLPAATYPDLVSAVGSLGERLN